jgi:RHH-type rel operon transcriptional repressor/antitoxin RelB
MNTITAKIPENLYDRLDHLAIETDRNKSYFIRQAIEDFLEEKEDHLIAIARMANKGKRYSLKEVKEDCGLDN